MTESARSRAGKKFILANGHEIADRGEMKPRLLLETGAMGTFTFSETDARKPLLAVGDCNKKGNTVWFDGHQSFVIPAGAPQLEQIRALIREVAGKVPLKWENNIFTMKTWQPEPESERPFVRPEK